MGTLTEKLSYLFETKAAIKEAIQGKGVPIPNDATFRSYAGIISAIPTGGEARYVRPSDWLHLPDITEAEQKVAMLYAVFANVDNFIAFKFTSSQPYTVDWGDGTTDIYSSNSKAEHIYDYEAISESTLCSRGYKQVIVTVTSTGNLLTADFAGLKHSDATHYQYISGLLDFKMSAPSLTKCVFGASSIQTRNSYLERFESVHPSTHLTSISYMFSDCSSLVEVVGLVSIATMARYTFNNCYCLEFLLNLSITGVTNYMDCFFKNCYKLRKVPDGIEYSGTIFDSFLSGCTSLTSVNLSLPNATSNNSLFTGCYSMIDVTIDVPKTTSLYYTFSGCNNLKRVNFIQTPLLVTDYQGCFNGCYCLEEIEVDFGAVTSTSQPGITFARYCYGLRKLRLLNMTQNTTSLTVTNTSLGRQALVELFGDLYDRTGKTAGSIAITGSAGAASLTPEERAIATEKNWNITG